MRPLYRHRHYRPLGYVEVAPFLGKRSILTLPDIEKDSQPRACSTVRTRHGVRPGWQKLPRLSEAVRVALDPRRDGEILDPFPLTDSSRVRSPLE